MATKPTLTPAMIESQSALELPERDMLSLVTIVAPITGNDVAVQVCAQAVTNLSAQNCQTFQ